MRTTSDLERSEEAIKDDIQMLPCSSNKIRVMPFAVHLTASMLQGLDEPTPLSQSDLVAGDAGIVGTITLLKKSAMVWFGWGKLARHEYGNDDTAASERTDISTAVGTGGPSFGQLVVSMPRTQYRGAFSDNSESASSLLIGGDSTEDQLVATKMASRLSQKTQYPVFVSCALSSTEDTIDPSTLAGLDRATVAQRAAALAERAIGKLLLEA